MATDLKTFQQTDKARLLMTHAMHTKTQDVPHTTWKDILITRYSSRQTNKARFLITQCTQRHKMSNVPSEGCPHHGAPPAASGNGG